MAARRTAVLGVVVGVATVLSACSDAEDVRVDGPATVETITEMPPGADPSTGSEPTGGTAATPTRGPTETVTLGPRQEYHITMAGSVSVLCGDGAELEVMAAAQVSITGSCGDVDVRTDGATIRFERVGDLDVEGQGNTLAGTRADELDVSGERNRVDVSRLRSIEVEGNQNEVRHRSGSIPIEESGQGNRITSS